MQVQSGSVEQERTRAHADQFLREVRLEIARCATEGRTFTPRVRSVHDRPGHATPEFRTLLISPTSQTGQLSPELLSVSIAHFAQQRAPDRLILALDAVKGEETEDMHSILIGEARDLAGTRLFFIQPYRVTRNGILWEEPLDGAWRDPGEEEMILDAAFTSRPARHRRTNPKSC